MFPVVANGLKTYRRAAVAAAALAAVVAAQEGVQILIGELVAIGEGEAEFKAYPSSWYQHILELRAQLTCFLELT